MQDMVGIGVFPTRVPDAQDLFSVAPALSRSPYSARANPLFRTHSGQAEDFRVCGVCLPLPKPSLQTYLSYTFIDERAFYRVRIIPMKITWDQPNRAANIAKHGLDFAALTEDFFTDALVISARSGRYLAIGKDVNGVISVVFVTLGLEGISVISMRPASRRERSLYNAQS